MHSRINIFQVCLGFTRIYLTILNGQEIQEIPSLKLQLPATLGPPPTMSDAVTSHHRHRRWFPSPKLRQQQALPSFRLLASLFRHLYLSVSCLWLLLVQHHRRPPQRWWRCHLSRTAAATSCCPRSLSISSVSRSFPFLLVDLSISPFLFVFLWFGTHKEKKTRVDRLYLIQF